MNHTTEQITARDGTRLAVHIFTPDGANGSGASPRDLVLLHGWPNAGRVWADLADDLLLAAPLRILAPDFRGFGDSDRPETGYTCSGFAQDVLDVVAALGVKPDWALAGHSMGGKIAQYVAAERPEGLSALALLTPAPLTGAPMPPDIAARKAAHGDPEKARELLATWAAHPLPEPVLQRLVEDAQNTGKAAWDGWLETMRGEDSPERAAGILVPTLVIGGGRDPLRSEEELRREVADRIRGATYAGLPRCGHLPHLEEPVTLAALLINFLDGLPKAVVESA
jgi:Predicted hydrolases or acyltransferases (alpha/beta hydrolase superfamily)